MNKNEGELQVHPSKIAVVQLGYVVQSTQTNLSLCMSRKLWLHIGLQHKYKKQVRWREGSRFPYFYPFNINKTESMSIWQKKISNTWHKSHSNGNIAITSIGPLRLLRT